MTGRSAPAADSHPSRQPPQAPAAVSRDGLWLLALLVPGALAAAALPMSALSRRWSDVRVPAMTLEKAVPDSGVEVKPVSSPPETGRAGWPGARVRPVLLCLVILVRA